MNNIGGQGQGSDSGAHTIKFEGEPTKRRSAAIINPAEREGSADRERSARKIQKIVPQRVAKLAYRASNPTKISGLNQLVIVVAAGQPIQSNHPLEESPLNLLNLEAAKTKAATTIQKQVRGRAGRIVAKEAKAEAFFNQMNVDSFQKIGDYGLVVKGADPKIQKLFDWMISPNAQSQEYIQVIINSKTGEFEGSFPRIITSPQGQLYLEKMKELGPTFLGYFRQLITKHPFHNKLIISCDCRKKRAPVYGLHQDTSSMPDLYGESPLFDREHRYNIKQWLKKGFRETDALMFAYKRSKDGTILPTTIAKMTRPSGLEKEITFSKEELVEMGRQGTVSCPAIGDRDVLLVNNLTALHATTSPDIAKALLGEGREKDFFESIDPPVMKEGTLNAPLLLIGVDSFYAP